ncbi:hypothetical protein K458DRAFT_403970 [Lentithecium fluviatile CBS 122367]|uniref:Uncharacterized protein n=1 Tax=Lentithecium fluviatile CBS 122367 TaxID=1168545 RepID=A0A6G1J2D7_9PLEO|nr:hypothetical protein K458DRAFT_403970 [Lentithecium fluviatile CBS 122367]
MAIRRFTVLSQSHTLPEEESGRRSHGSKDIPLKSCPALPFIHGTYKSNHLCCCQRCPCPLRSHSFFFSFSRISLWLSARPTTLCRAGELQCRCSTLSSEPRSSGRWSSSDSPSVPDYAIRVHRAALSEPGRAYHPDGVGPTELSDLCHGVLIMGNYRYKHAFFQASLQHKSDPRAGLPSKRQARELRSALE